MFGPFVLVEMNFAQTKQAKSESRASSSGTAAFGRLCTRQARRGTRKRWRGCCNKARRIGATDRRRIGGGSAPLWATASKTEKPGRRYLPFASEGVTGSPLDLKGIYQYCKYCFCFCFFLGKPLGLAKYILNHWVRRSACLIPYMVLGTC